MRKGSEADFGGWNRKEVKEILSTEVTIWQKSLKSRITKSQKHLLSLFLETNGPENSWDYKKLWPTWKIGLSHQIHEIFMHFNLDVGLLGRTRGILPEISNIFKFILKISNSLSTFSKCLPLSYLEVQRCHLLGTPFVPWIDYWLVFRVQWNAPEWLWHGHSDTAIVPWHCTLKGRLLGIMFFC
jgi:hypothetical protein